MATKAKRPAAPRKRATGTPSAMRPLNNPVKTISEDEDDFRVSSERLKNGTFVTLEDYLAQHGN